jgi:hypothetical protein
MSDLIKSLIFLVSINFCSCKDERQVLICESGTAHAYHKSMCKGLKKCTHSIKTVTKNEAIEMHRDQCDYCYN